MTRRLVARLLHAAAVCAVVATSVFVLLHFAPGDPFATALDGADVPPSVRAGFTTVSRVIANTADGLDIEDIITERKRELELFDEADIDVDTTVEEPIEEAPAAAAPAMPAVEPDEEPEDAAPARVVKMRINA